MPISPTGSLYPAGTQVQRMMSFTESVQTCLKKYFCFKGRASRSEYWWWTLVYSLIQFLLVYCSVTLYSKPSGKILYVLIAVFAAAIIPSLAVSVRRMHDTGCSGWWVLLFNVLIGLGSSLGKVLQNPWFCLIVPCITVYFYSRPSEMRPNKYGDVPCLEPVQSRDCQIHDKNMPAYSSTGFSQPAYVPEQRMMSFTESIESCFKKYFCFTGRASRSEYWWWTLSYVMTLFLLIICIGSVYSEDTAETLIIVSLVFFVAGIIPTVAASIRRLHDTGCSGWWLLLFAMPLILGCAVQLLWVILLASCILTYFLSKPSEQVPNHYGNIPCLKPVKWV